MWLDPEYQSNIKCLVHVQGSRLESIILLAGEPLGVTGRVSRSMQIL